MAPSAEWMPGEAAATTGAGRTSIPPNAFYVPSPVVLLSTQTEAGEVDVSAMSAVGVVCLDPPILAVGIKPRRQTYKNIRRTGSFVVNLPLQDGLEVADYTGTRSWRKEPEKVEKAGLEVARLPESGLPYLPSCPISMACTLIGNLGRNELGLDMPPSHQVVLGRMTECSVDSTWVGEDEVRLEDMPILVYLNRVYAGRGDVLGIQRFTDDPAKREAKMREYRSLGVRQE
ncbi:flavin reductase family protein [Streptomyces virginiae]|uniref:flavin reductase family protein n=1 Tax=Streptomyces virginiae TaxID=1961 RepID=UPI00068B6CBD|nr:flavin reductase family protein [Streptomyces virginiae]